MSEKAALAVGTELERRHLELALQEMADGYADELRINHHHDKYGSRPEKRLLLQATPAG